MKNIFFLFISIFALQIANAQYGWTYIDEFPDAVIGIVENDDNSVTSLSGAWEEYWPDDSLVLSIKNIDSNGVLVWQSQIKKMVPSGLTSILSREVDFFKASDGSYIFSYWNDAEYVPSVMKIGPTGELIWDTDILNIFPDPNCIYPNPLVFQCAFDKIAIIAIDEGPSSFEWNGYTLDLATGALLSNALLDIPELFTNDSNMAFNHQYSVTDDSGVIITCDNYDNTAYAWKINNVFETEWLSQIEIETPEWLESFAISETEDGGYILLGNYYWWNADWFYWNSKLFLSKVDSLGNWEWTQYYGDDTTYSYSTIVDVLPNNHIVAFNQHNSLVYAKQEFIEFDESGSFVQTNTLDNEYNPNVFAMAACIDGSIAYGGSIYMEGIIGEDFKNFIQKSGTDGEFYDCMFNCVWPGDANNDSIADLDDLLTIGIAYDASGPLREEPGNEWYAHASDAWIDTLADGTNYKYADCNGDGTINDADTMAISLNYGSEHPVYTLKTNGGDDEIYLDPADDTLPLGLVEIPIMLGDDATPITLYGLRFSITFEGDEVIDSTTMVVDFNTSWLGAPGELLTMNKQFPETKTIDAGATRIDHNNVTGGGQIGTLSFVVIDNIAGKIFAGATELTITISNINAITKDENNVPLNGSSYTFHLATGIDNETSDQFIIYPNPVSGNELFIYSTANHFINELCISDITGRTIFTVSNIDISTPVEIPSLPNGEYILKLYCDQGIKTLLLVVSK